MSYVARSYVAASVIGAVHAVRQGRVARFAGVRLPGTPVQHALTIGSPLSAPPLMHLALLAGAGHGLAGADHGPAAAEHGRDEQRHRRAVRLLGLLFLVGIAGEVDTWSTLRRPVSDPISTVCVLLLVALPVAMIRGNR